LPSPLAFAAGGKTWARLLQRIEQQRALLDYRLAHQGKDPPLPMSKKYAKLFCPMWFPEDKISHVLLEEVASIRDAAVLKPKG